MENSFPIYGKTGYTDVIDEDFGPVKIDKEKVGKLSGKHRGSVRLSCGRYYTLEEFEQRKRRVLSRLSS